MIHHRRFGFTLIEILVVVTISLVIGGVMLARYGNFRDRQVVERGAELFATELRKIQAKADAGELSGCGAKGLDYYEVYTGDDTGGCYTSASVTPVCADGTSGDVQPSIGLTNGLQLYGSSQVKFMSRGRGVIADFPNALNFNIQGNTNCTNVTVQVETSGKISTGTCPTTSPPPTLECT